MTIKLKGAAQRPHLKKGDRVQFTDRGTTCLGTVLYAGKICVTVEVTDWKPFGETWRHGDYKRHLTYIEDRADFKVIGRGAANEA